MLLLFATRNGASRSLEKMLAQLRRVKRPLSGLRIIAVDSASDDRTLALLREAGDLLDQVISVRSPGKNLALNKALDVVIGSLGDKELIVFTDDDVLPDPEWLKRYEATALSQTDIDLFGGQIDPVFPVEIDPWLNGLHEKFQVLFAASHRPSGPCDAEDIYGPNMAIRARCFKSGTRFEPTIGPDGSQTYPMGSETELCRRLATKGKTAYYVSQAKVGHMITAEQMSYGAVMRRARRHGAGFAQIHFKEKTDVTWAGAPRWIWRRLALALLSLVKARAVGSDGEIAKARYEVAWCEGVIHRSRTLTRKSKVPDTCGGLANMRRNLHHVRDR